PEVANFLQYAVQLGLVDDGARQKRGPIALPGEGEAVKPGGPAGSKVPFEADFVPHDGHPSRGFAVMAFLVGEARLRRRCEQWLVCRQGEGRRGCGEASSPGVVTEVVISSPG